MSLDTPSGRAAMSALIGNDPSCAGYYQPCAITARQDPGRMAEARDRIADDATAFHSEEAVAARHALKTRARHVAEELREMLGAYAAMDYLRDLSCDMLRRPER